MTQGWEDDPVTSMRGELSSFVTRAHAVRGVKVGFTGFYDVLCRFEHFGRLLACQKTGRV